MATGPILAWLWTMPVANAPAVNGCKTLLNSERCVAGWAEAMPCWACVKSGFVGPEGGGSGACGTDGGGVWRDGGQCTKVRLRPVRGHQRTCGRLLHVAGVVGRERQKLVSVAGLALVDSRRVARLVEPDRIIAAILRDVNGHALAPQSRRDRPRRSSSPGHSRCRGKAAWRVKVVVGAVPSMVCVMAPVSCGGALLKRTCASALI